MESFGNLKKTKIMILDENAEFRTQAATNLRNHGFDVVLTTSDPHIAVSALKSTEPDIVLFDMIFSGMDGIAFLEMAKRAYQNDKTRYIAMSGISNEVLIKEVINIGATYYLIKPINYTLLAERINLLCRPEKEEHHEQSVHPEIKNDDSVQKDLEVQVTEEILEIGIPAHVKGYHYVRSAIILAITEPDVINAVTKIIYPTIAKQYKTSPSRVERAIRHAIEVAWDRGNVDTLNSIFGYSISSSRGKPTNSEFIAMIADRLRLKNKNSGRSDIYCRPAHF